MMFEAYRITTADTLNILSDHPLRDLSADFLLG
jgi:hypothetical protein